MSKPRVTENVFAKLLASCEYVGRDHEWLPEREEPMEIEGAEFLPEGTVVAPGVRVVQDCAKCRDVRYVRWIAPGGGSWTFPKAWDFIVGKERVPTKLKLFFFNLDLRTKTPRGRM